MKKKLEIVLFIVIIGLITLTAMPILPIESWLRAMKVSEDTIEVYSNRFKPFLLTTGSITIVISVISMFYSKLKSTKIKEKETIKIAETNSASVLEALRLQIEQNELIIEQNSFNIEMLIERFEKPSGVITSEYSEEMLNRAKEMANKRLNITKTMGNLNRAIMATKELNLTHSDRVKIAEADIKELIEKVKSTEDSFFKPINERKLEIAMQLYEDLTGLKFKE